MTRNDGYRASDGALTDDDVRDSDARDSDGSDGEHGAGVDGAEVDGAGVDGAGVDGAGVNGARVGVLLHPAQAEAIVSALDKVPATVPVDDRRVAEEQLVELGRTHGPLDLRKAGRLVRDRLDTDGPEPAEQKAYDRETLTLKNADNGVAFTGYLANENAELFRTLIHTHAKPHKTIDGAHDPRPRTKRQADALTTILTTTGPTTTAATLVPADPNTATAPPAAATTAGSAGSHAGNRQGRGFAPGHGPKPHITVTIDFNDLKAATADKLGHLIYGDALSAATIRRLACDAQILPIVLGSDSQPLDVGTTVRLATGPIRKALIARDKGCVCCGAPPLYCDAHHVKSWIDEGATKITNLVLLCKRCHRDLHAGHWTIHITNGIVHVDRPMWATPDPVPRGRYRQPTTIRDPGSTTASSTGGAAGGSTRAWPREMDPPWIKADDAARLNPWGDAVGSDPGRSEPGRSEPGRSEAGRSEAGGYVAPEERPTRAPTHSDCSDFDPWGDGGKSTVTSRSRNNPANENSAAFDPWGDSTTPHSAGSNDLAGARAQRRRIHQPSSADSDLAS